MWAEVCALRKKQRTTQGPKWPVFVGNQIEDEGSCKDRNGKEQDAARDCSTRLALHKVGNGAIELVLLAFDVEVNRVRDALRENLARLPGPV